MSEGWSRDIYFDSDPPPPPPEIFGFSTDLAFELCASFSGLGIASSQLSSDGHILEGAIELLPLLQKVQSEETVSPNDVRPYRKAIKKVVPGIGTADEIMTLLTVIPPVGIVGRIALNKTIEREFAHRVPEAIEKANEYLPRALPYVELMEGFKNPKRQFIEEISVLNAAIINLLTGQGYEPGSRDAAAAISEVFNQYVLGEDSSQLPMIEGILAVQVARRGRVKLPQGNMLAAVAPEILTMLGAPLPKDDRAQAIIDSVRRDPVALRQAARFIKRDELCAFQEVAPKILPTIRDLLPTQGKMIRQGFEDAKRFLEPKLSA